MSSPTVLVVEHEDKCPPALVGDWLAEAGCALEVCRPYAGDELPALDGVRRPAGPGRPDGRPRRRAARLARPGEGAGARRGRATALPTLGICLGHQLIAVALGGTVGTQPARPAARAARRRLDRRGRRRRAARVRWPRPRRGVQWNDDVVTALPDGRHAAGGRPPPARSRRCGSRRRCGACSCTPRSTSAVLRPVGGVRPRLPRGARHRPGRAAPRDRRGPRRAGRRLAAAGRRRSPPWPRARRADEPGGRR